MHPPLDDEIDLEVLHGWIQELLHDVRQPVDLVHEQDVAGLDAREDAHEIVAALERRPRARLEPAAHLVGEDDRQRRLAEPGWPVEEHVVQALVALPSSLDRDPEALDRLALADVLVQALGPQRALERRLVRERAPAEQVLAHAVPRRAR